MSARAGEGARREQRRSVRLDELMSKRLCDRLRSTPKTSHKAAKTTLNLRLKYRMSYLH